MENLTAETPLAAKQQNIPSNNTGLCTKGKKRQIEVPEASSKILKSIKKVRKNISPEKEMPETSRPTSKKKSTEKVHKSADQLMVLNQSYHENPYPTRWEKIRLSELTGLSDQKINYWLCNKRSKEKKVKEGRSNSEPKKSQSKANMMSVEVDGNKENAFNSSPTKWPPLDFNNTRIMFSPDEVFTMYNVPTSP